MKIISIVILAAMAVIMGGCQQSSARTTPPPAPEPVEDMSASAGMDAPPVIEPAEPPVEEYDPMRDLLSQTTILFDFDRSEIRPEYRDVVSAHASALADSPGMSVRLEGHADERGSREYNIGLGERRAQSVRRAMMLQGVGAGQIETVSFGEERPVDSGHNESAWAQNRRVEIIYSR